jgi:hypothetical protein
MVVVPNYQTMGTLFVGVMTSVATWFMFGYRSLPGDPLQPEEDLYSYLSHKRSQEQLQVQGRRFPKNVVGIPETMYPRQTEIALIRNIDKSIDQIILVSTSWLPRHGHYLKLV